MIASSFPLVREEAKLSMISTVKELNATIQSGPDFTFASETDPDDDFWDWHFHKCCVCDKTWYIERATCNGTTSETVKLHDGLRCPHCGRGYCSFEHMKPKILIPNTDDINELTGIKSCVIYKICAAYLNHMTMSHVDDSFCSEDGGYEITFINVSISKSINNIKLNNLRYVLMNQDVQYNDKSHYLKEDVVQFVDRHFNDCKKYKKQIAANNGYNSTDAIMIISTFVGCCGCLKEY